jgi:hypothetical protein
VGLSETCHLAVCQTGDRRAIRFLSAKSLRGSQTPRGPRHCRRAGGPRRTGIPIPASGCSARGDRAKLEPGNHRETAGARQGRHHQHFLQSNGLCFNRLPPSNFRLHPLPVLPLKAEGHPHAARTLSPSARNRKKKNCETNPTPALTITNGTTCSGAPGFLLRRRENARGRKPMADG